MRTADSTHPRHTRRSTVANAFPGSGTGVMTTTNGVSAGAVHYFEIGGADDLVTSVFIRWFDATSNAAIVLQTTNLPVGESAYNSTSTTEWATETTVITGPVATAAGCTMVHLSNNAARRNRLKVTVTATTELEIIANGIH